MTGVLKVWERECKVGCTDYFFLTEYLYSTWWMSPWISLEQCVQTVRLWQGTDDGTYNCAHILKDHTAEVRSRVKCTLLADERFCLIFYFFEGLFVDSETSTLCNSLNQVQAVTVQATKKYFVSAGMDNTWCFYDLPTGSCLKQVYPILFNFSS